MRLERRRHPRHLTALDGRIAFNDSRSVIDCKVANLSEDGALLRVERVIGIPDTFDLHIGSEIYFAWVVWKQPGKIGVTWHRQQVRERAHVRGANSRTTAKIFDEQRKLRDSFEWLDSR
jgi:hypothetical protein